MIRHAATRARTPYRTLASMLVTVVAAAACTPGDAADDLVVRRDSAGIAIVESTAPRWGADTMWQVDTAALLDLTQTGATSDHEFYHVADALRLADGSIVVADGGSHQVRRFSPDGTLQWAVGRDGDGPGEFRQLMNVTAYRSDSIVAFDFWLGRATVIGADGGIGRAFYPDDPGPGIERLLALGDTAFVAQLTALDSMEGNAGLFRIPTRVVTVTGAGTIADTLTTMPGIETFLLPRGDMRPLFPRTGHLAAADGRIYVGGAERMEFTVLSPDGQVERIVRVPTYDLRVTPDEVERERAVMLGPRPSSRGRELVGALPSPATRPAYAQLVADATGAVWAARFRALADTVGPTAWELFDADGAWLGAIELPRRLRVLEIGRDHLLAVHPDSMDVERVQLLRVRRGER